MSLTGRLADLVVGLRDQPPPEEVAGKARLHILDTLGCQVAFATMPWAQQALAYAAAGGSRPESTLMGRGQRVCAEHAAFANATCAHGFEMDDTDLPTASHPGAVVVPTALAVAEAHHASGADLVRAVVAGYEVMLRVARGGMDMMRRGFHTTAVAGPFGAAAATCSLLRLDAERTAHALGIAASQASGIAEYTVSGGSVKRVHAGFAAQSGLRSALLAQAGITAPSEALEGRRGLLAAVADRPEPDRVVEGLGERYVMLGTGMKPHCCCAAQHSVLDALDEVLRDDAVTEDSIAEIRVRQNPREVEVVGKVVEPTDVANAQFSAAFGIALRIVAGSNSYTAYEQAPLDDPRLLSLAHRVRYTAAPLDDPIEGDAPCELTVVLDDATTRQATVARARGTGSGLPQEEVEAKFLDLTQGVLGDRAQQALDLVLRLDNLPDVTALTGLLVSD